MSILKNVQTFIEYSEFFSEQNINIGRINIESMPISVCTLY